MKGEIVVLIDSIIIVSHCSSGRVKNPKHVRRNRKKKRKWEVENIIIVLKPLFNLSPPLALMCSLFPVN